MYLQQETLLLQTDRATRYVSQNPVNWKKQAVDQIRNKSK